MSFIKFDPEVEMTIEDASSAKKFEAVVEPMTSNDFKVVKKDKKRFNSFNWDAYKAKEIYKLRLAEDDTILGIMCLADHPGNGFNAIEIELLEVSVENRGKAKKMVNIAGCLIAFACREAFKRGYEGWVFLVPKTNLIVHYQAQYGFTHIPIKSRPEGLMELNTNGSQKLIKKYIG